MEFTSAEAARRAASLAQRLRGVTIAAALTPMSADGRVQVGSIPAYVDRLTAAGIGGLAVWAHTGRGPFLSPADQDAVLAAFRAGTPLPIVAGIGVRASPAPAPAEELRAYEDLARRARAGGADAVMVFPPASVRDEPDREERVLEFHARVAAAGLPVIAFLLHAEAGGYPYTPRLWRSLLALPGLAGVKLATLDSAMTCQDTIALMREEFPDRLVLTGEDRMFGPSFLWGAHGALVGIASALPELTVAVVDAWRDRDLPAFVAASERLDRLAEVTFTAPMEGYVQRMLWLAADTGLLPADHAHDPYGPRLDPAERAAVIAVARALADPTPGC